MSVIRFCMTPWFLKKTAFTPMQSEHGKITGISGKSLLDVLDHVFRLTAAVSL